MKVGYIYILPIPFSLFYGSFPPRSVPSRWRCWSNIWDFWSFVFFSNKLTSDCEFHRSVLTQNALTGSEKKRHTPPRWSLQSAYENWIMPGHSQNVQVLWIIPRKMPTVLHGRTSTTQYWAGLHLIRLDHCKSHAARLANAVKSTGKRCQQ